MKTLVTILFISTFMTCSVLAQTVLFEKGQIITKNNDTINALVEFTPTYYKTVSYKKNAESSVQKIKISEIKSLSTPYNIFQNVTANDNEMLFRLVVSGKTTLLEYSKINITSSQDANGGTMTKYGPPTLIYSIRTNEAEYIVKKKKDIDQILPLLEKCPDALVIVNDKAFKLPDLEKVVNSLNKCK